MSIQPQDFAYLSRLVFADLKNHKIGSPEYKTKNSLYQELKSLARRKRREPEPAAAGKPKEPTKYLCLSCDKVHTKLNTRKTCPSCGSDDVEKQNKLGP